jgi:hypothetical protein
MILERCICASGDARSPPGAIVTTAFSDFAGRALARAFLLKLMFRAWTTIRVAHLGDFDRPN